MMDKAEKMPVEIVCNQIIMKNIYGRVLGEPKCKLIGEKEDLEVIDEIIKENFELVCVHKLIEIEDEKKKYQEKKEGMISFHDFISEIMYPQKSINIENEKKYELEEVRKHNEMVHTRKLRIRTDFLDLSIGRRFREFRKILLHEMTKIEPDSIVPSFFTLLEYLRKEEFEFKIVFRTFGFDIGILIDEYNRFCCGKHNRFPNVDWMKNKKLSLEQLPNRNNIGHFFRTDEKDTLVLGTFGANDIQDIISTNNDNNSTSSQLKLIDTTQEIYNFFFSGNFDDTIAVRDHYHFWNTRGELGKYGKIFLVDTKETETLQIFFDDWMIFDQNRKGIVDLFDISSNRHLDLVENYGLYVWTCKPLKAILDEKYFIEKVGSSLRKFSKRRCFV